MTTQPGGAIRELCAAADEALRQASFCTGEFAEAERLFSGAAAAATRDGDPVGLAEAVAEGGDLYSCSEIHRHLGFYYLLEDIRPKEAVRQFGHSLELRERIGDPRLRPSALVVLSGAELAAGNPERAVGLLRRAVAVAREASLLPWRVQDAEDTLRKAEAAAQGGR